jgi:hypothetical protein
MTTLTRRQTLVGAAATVAAAALPAVKADVVMSGYPRSWKTFIRYDDQWPEGPIDNDLFVDRLHNLRWWYDTECWVLIDVHDRSKPWEMRSFPKSAVVRYVDRNGNEWAGGAEYIGDVLFFNERDVMHETDIGWVVTPAVQYEKQELQS